jgi:hypothetical protein
MIAEVCREYGWTVDHVLAMPVRRFFAMLEAARMLRAKDMLDLADIAAIPACTPKYAEGLKSSLSAPLRRSSQPRPAPRADYSGSDARRRLIQMMGLKKVRKDVG